MKSWLFSLSLVALALVAFFYPYMMAYNINIGAREVEYWSVAILSIKNVAILGAWALMWYFIFSRGLGLLRRKRCRP